MHSYNNKATLMQIGNIDDEKRNWNLFYEMIKKHFTGLQPDSNSRLAIPAMNGYTIIDLNEILYCQAKRNYTMIYLDNGDKMMVSKNLGKLERLLNPTTFLRIHRSFIVNFTKIRQLKKGKTPIIVLSDCTQLEVSIHKKDALLKRLHFID